MIKRDQEEYFIDLITGSNSPHNVLFVVGARQVGKTTFINQVLSNSFEGTEIIRINLEEELTFRADLDKTQDFSDFETLMKLKGLDPLKKQIVFIDEAQESEKLGYYVRFMKEKWLQTRCILSGSSMTRLFRQDQRFPVGRVTIVKLNPFSFNEFLDATGKQPLKEICTNFLDELKISPIIHAKLLESMDEYLRIGGIPEVVLDYAQGKDFQLRRRSILLAQQDDFTRKTSIESRDSFMAGLRGVANFLGSVSKYTHIAKSTKDASQLISVLKNWHLVNEVEQKGMSSTTNFFPKRYLYDIGIAVQVRNMPFPTISILDTIDPAMRTQLGGLFENLVYLQLCNQTMSQGEISGWKESNKNQVEVDFILQRKLPIPIECKASMKVTNRSFSGMRRYLAQSSLKVGVLVSATPYKVIEDGDIRLINIPIYLAQPEIIEELVKKYS